MLSFENITFSRNGSLLCNALGMSLFPGAALIIRGKNGSGKTTLLRMLAGLAQPDEGVVCWNEVPIMEEYDTYCSLISYLGHKNMLTLQSTVRENVAFWAGLKQAEEMVDAALSYYQLDHKQYVPCRILSAGWKQRVALARVMASPAKCWILDEPTTYLDDEGVDRLMNAITVRCREGGIVVMTAHKELPIKGAITLDLGDGGHHG